MRTLHVYSGNLFGGIERTLLTFAGLAGRFPSLEMHMAICFEGTLTSELRKFDTPVHMLSPVRMSRPWTLWSARRKLKKLLQESQFDLVVAHACWSHVVAAPVVRKMKIPFVAWAHDALTGDHFLEKKARRWPADLYIANSEFTAGTVRRVFGNDAPIEVQYPPVTFTPPSAGEDVRGEVRRELGIDPSTCVILLASRFERWKGHTMLIDAAARLKDRSDWICLIAGGAQREHEEQYRDELIAQAKRLGIESKVRFLGHRSDVNRLLQAADIHCQPNTAPEPFGVAFVEAMQAGVPVVTTAQGGPMETVDSTCGVLTPPGDVPALSAALARLMDDPALRRSLGQGGIQRAARICDGLTVLGELHEKFDRLLRSRPQTSSRRTAELAPAAGA